MIARTPRAAALATIVWSAGCQLAFPLPDEASGGAHGGTRSSASITPDGASSGMVACASPECSTYCTDIETTCTAAPQFHTSAECCAICASWDAGARDCRDPSGSDAISCTRAGPFAGLPCADQCGALCAAYRAICGDETPSQCEQDCATKWDGLVTFDACKPEGNDTRACRMSRLLEAAVETEPMKRDEACKRAKDGKCMPGMGNGPCE